MNFRMGSTLLTFALGGSIVIAQQTTPGQAAPSDAPPSAAMKHAARHNPHKEARMLARRLNLTPDQTTKTEVVLADRDQQISALRADASVSPEGLKDRRSSIRLDTMQKLSNIFTPEQMQQMKSIQRHRAGRGVAPAVPSPA